MADIESVRLPDNSIFNIKDPTALHGTDGINALADVSASSPSDSDLLIYNGSTSKWTAQANPFTKPNLLENGWFTVNQRGASSYSTIYGETVDDWLIMGNDTTVAVSSNGITLSRSSLGTAYLRNILKSTYVHGKTVTASVKLQDGTILHGTDTFPSTATTVDINMSADVGVRLGISGSNETYFQLMSLQGNAINVRAAKLELGSISTLANDTEPNKNVEIIKCQNPLRVVGTPNIYRGQEITLNADFWARIADGSFENQQVGDTITINGRKYTLAHANYWLHTGDTACETNHWVVISPNMGNAKMNNDNSTTGGYLGSGFRSGTNHDNTSNTALADAIATIKSDFGASHILSHREFLDNAVTGGYPSSGVWVDSEAELMSQIMAYGNRFYDPSTNLGTTIPILYSVDKSQLALYAQRPDLLTDRSSWWLRDVVSAAYFAYVIDAGYARFNNASNSFGVRLVFGIKA